MPSLSTGVLPRLTRSSSFAEVLNELDKIKLELEAEEISKQHRRDHNVRSSPGPPSISRTPSLTPPTGFPLLDAALFGIALSVSAALVLGVTRASAVALPVCLISLALALLGVGNVMDFRASRTAVCGAVRSSWMRVPLTDAKLGLEQMNRFANSCQVREKGLKIVQYLLRLGAYSMLLPPSVADRCKALSKTTSMSRRLFKFCRWVKHFDEFAAARTEQRRSMRALFFLRGCANLCADWSEDVCSLERIGLLPPGTLSPEFHLVAEYCQLALAFVEVSISAVMVNKQQQVAALVTEKSEDSASDGSNMLKAYRQLAMLRLELIKFVSDIGKAVHDCELHFSHEAVFIGNCLI